MKKQLARWHEQLNRLGLRCRAWAARTGLAGAPDLRRRWLAGVALLPWIGSLASANQHAAAAAGEVVIGTLQLRNDSDAAQSANFVSPMLGLPVRQGDVPAGQWPRFVLQDGRECAATLWAESSWPDGSMKFCGAMLRVPADIAAGQMVVVRVRADGRKPEPGPRAIGDLAQADLKVELTGVTDLSGRWVASLNDGVREAVDVTLIGNGAAGAIWRIGSEFRDERGAAHGQLYCWHYIAALNSTDGRLLGLRYLGRVAQPWGDVSSPSPRRREFSASVKSGNALIRALLGHAATETPGETIRLPHYASFFTAGPQARWDFVRGGGTHAQDSVVRVVLDAAYVQRTKLVPPYDLTVRPQPGAAIPYYPMGAGSATRHMGTTGEREDIGVIPNWHVRHLLEPNAANETLARVNGLVAGGWRVCFRQRGTRQPVACVDLQPKYQGMGTIRTNWRGYQHLTGMVKPEPNESLWYEEAAHRPGSVYWPYLFSAEPQFLDLMLEIGCAHVLQLADGNDTVWSIDPARTAVWEGRWGGERGLTIGKNGTLFKGSGVLLDGLGSMRVSAWRSRDVAQAAALAPDQAADGVAVRAYLRDVMGSSYAGFAEYAAKMPAEFRASGLFIQHKGDGSPWTVAYMSWSICHQADILASSQAAFVRRYLSRFYTSFAAIADIGCLVAYRCTYWDADGRAIRSSKDLLCNLRCTLTFTAADSRVTVSAGRQKLNGSWKPHDGDVFAFGERGQPAPFPSMNALQRLYAVRCNGQSFQLALQPGGEPLTVPSNVVVTQFLARLKDLSPDLAFDEVDGPSGYSANMRGAVTYHAVCGDDVTEAKQGLDAIVAARRIDFRSRAKYSIQSSRG